jgi:hypothetical protein
VKIYNSSTALNPRRVRVFLTEQGIQVRLRDALTILENLAKHILSHPSPYSARVHLDRTLGAGRF